jgi:hypothetical protein
MTDGKCWDYETLVQLPELVSRLQLFGNKRQQQPHEQDRFWSCWSEVNQIKLLAGGKRQAAKNCEGWKL